MHPRFRLLICLATAVLFLASCSSGTVVARDERATAAVEDPAQSDALADSDADSGSDADAAENNNPEDNGPEDLDAEDSDPDADAAEDNNPEDNDAEDDDADSDSERGSRETVENPSGFGLGGAEQLAGLLADCQDGNDLACDILYQISDFDSPEETAAITCGGRSDVEVAFCTAGIDGVEGDFVFDEDSEGLDRVIEACQLDANMTACDFLFYRSPLDSEFQEIGGTCGGRVNVAVPDCRTVGNW